MTTKGMAARRANDNAPRAIAVLPLIEDFRLKRREVLTEMSVVSGNQRLCPVKGQKGRPGNTQLTTGLRCLRIFHAARLLQQYGMAEPLIIRFNCLFR